MRREEIEIDVINPHEKTEIKLLKYAVSLLREIRDELRPARVKTPLTISFKELTMLSADAGNTLVYTGTLSPAGAQFPAGTTFSVKSNYPNVSPTVDSTGLIVTIPLGSDFVEDPNNPLSVAWSSSTFTPEPASSPASLSSAITPSVPTPTPTGIAFAQTT